VKLKMDSKTVSMGQLLLFAMLEVLKHALIVSRCVLFAEQGSLCTLDWIEWEC
jgi:hypothetical protein